MGYGDGGSGEKIKGGDVLIFRMEILKILGGKVRAAKCDVMTKENCEPDEVKVLEQWDKKSLAEIEAEVSRLKKHLEGTLKSGDREKAALSMGMLKKLKKGMK